MDESLIIEIWDTFREYIPDKHKETAANQYVDFLLGKDVEVDTLEGYIGYDPYLDEAIRTVVDAENMLSEEDDIFEEDED